MLERSAARDVAVDEERTLGIQDFRRFLSFLSEAKWAVLVYVLASLATALLLIAVSPRLYTAQTSLLVDSNRGQLSRSRDDMNNLGRETAEIETQLQILKSQKIALLVVDRLGLDRDPLFIDDVAPKLPSFLRGLFSPAPSAAAWEVGADRRHRASMRLADALSVSRIGASYVVSVSANAADPARAAEIANTVTELYITDRVEARLESAQRTNLEQERQRELRMRILSSAIPPLSPSYPRRRIILAVAAIFGAFFGFGMVALRWAMDDKLRSPEQVSSAGVRLLASIPATRFVKGNFRRAERRPSKFRYARLNPLSSFAQSVRKIKSAVQIAKTRLEHGFCLGILSVMPGEGKSTVARNLADLLGAAGRRTVLLELDLQNLDGDDALDDDSALNYHFLSGAKLRATLSSNEGQQPLNCELPVALDELLGSEQMELFLSQCRRDYDYVLVDCPSGALLSDAIAVTGHLDALIVVAEWGRLPFDLFATNVSSLDGGSSEFLGVVLNKLPPKHIDGRNG
jgi:polysaccharide biosynthesis transport protein